MGDSLRQTVARRWAGPDSDHAAARRPDADLGTGRVDRAPRRMRPEESSRARDRPPAHRGDGEGVATGGRAPFLHVARRSALYGQLTGAAGRFPQTLKQQEFAEAIRSVELAAALGCWALSTLRAAAPDEIRGVRGGGVGPPRGRCVSDVVFALLAPAYLQTRRQLGRLVATEHHVFRGASDMRC